LDPSTRLDEEWIDRRLLEAEAEFAGPVSALRADQTLIAISVGLLLASAVLLLVGLGTLTWSALVAGGAALTLASLVAHHRQRRLDQP